MGSPLTKQASRAMKSSTDITLSKTATLSNTLLIGALWLVMALFVMPEAMRQNRVYTGRIEKPGASFRHSPDTFYQITGLYGEQGRQHFIAIELTADMFYAVVTSLLLCFLMLRSFYFSKNHHLKSGHLIRLAFFALLTSLLENAGMVVLLWDYPATHRNLYFLTAIFSILKIASVVAALGIVAWNLAFYHNRKQKPEPAP